MARIFVLLISFATLSAQQSTVPAPVGTHTELGLAGYAKVLCSAVFVSGRDAAEAAKNSALLLHAAPRRPTR